jgi:molybdopterin-guanine dinucleotide biosynthesis adapter protein
MRSIISLVGKSSSGKTTLMEKLIVELKRRGLKPAVVKHSHHADDLDTSKKDTWRFTQAGAALSAINSLDHLAIFQKMDHFFTPEEISTFVLWDYDVILTEGFKGSPYPKIEVHRAEQGKDLVSEKELLLAVVTDEKLDLGVPQYAHEDVAGIADLIEKKVKAEAKNSVDVVVNGTRLNVSSSFEDLLTRTLMAMVPSEDGIKSMHVSLRRKA